VLKPCSKNHLSSSSFPSGDVLFLLTDFMNGEGRASAGADVDSTQEPETVRLRGALGLLARPHGDKELYSFTIITTQPNAFCGRFITVCQSFTTEHGGQWLEHSFGGRSMTLTAMLQPLPSADGSSRRFDAG
jgi:hypothetical protein